MTPKKELRLALIWIVAYVVIMSIFDNIFTGEVQETMRIIPSGLFLAVMMITLNKSHRLNQYGFISFQDFPWKATLYLLPMLVLSTVNLWNGTVLRYSPWVSVLSILSMFCIGFIEELLFRGLLLKALLHRSVGFAITISSLTFGLGHIVNLLSGADLGSTLLQLVYALAIGLMLSVFVVKTGNILPCCLFHGLFNALSVFCNESGWTMQFQIIVCIIITAVSAGYALYLWKNKKLPSVWGLEQE